MQAKLLLPTSFQHDRLILFRFISNSPNKYTNPTLKFCLATSQTSIGLFNSKSVPLRTESRRFSTETRSWNWKKDLSTQTHAHIHEHLPKIKSRPFKCLVVVLGFSNFEMLTTGHRGALSFRLGAKGTETTKTLHNYCCCEHTIYACRVSDP